MLLLTIFFSLILGSLAKNDEIIVQTEYGYVRGARNVTVEKQKNYFGFQGIPFAQPPVGELRFQPPKPPKPWDGVLDVVTEKPMCVQGVNPVIGEEDCLYLNVYTPEINPSNKLPVMVWIHGGGFFSGDTLYTNFGPDYLLDQDVIVVTISYRIGVFGFISTNDLVAPGNAGLKDQNLALKWIKNNIANFGGDPNRITIFGSSAGGVSGSLHLLSAKSKDLFNGVIMQSGTSLCLWSLSRLAKTAAFQIGENLKLNTTNSESLLTDLKTVDAETLQTIASITFAALLVTNNPRSGLIFAPVIEPEHEDAFITEKSYEMFKNGNFTKVPTIIGYNSLEADIYLILPIMLYFERYDLRVEDLIPVDMNIDNSTILGRVGLEIKLHYFGILPIAANKESTAKYISDDQFNRPIHETMRLISKYQPVYCYRFSYIGELGQPGEKVLEGVQHGEEVGYFWRTNNSENANERDKLTRDRVIKLWTNFAKYGNPTPDGDTLLQNVIWPHYLKENSANVNCLDIRDNLDIAVNPDIKGRDFYRSLYEQYGKPPYDTY